MINHNAPRIQSAFRLGSRFFSGVGDSIPVARSGRRSGCIQANEVVVLLWTTNWLPTFPLMVDTENLTTKLTELVVLYADITDSTRLYEEHGDAKARDAVAHCVQIMSSVVQGLGGRVVKTIGDEIMCVFEHPVKALMAGGDIHGVVRRASEAGEFATGPLRVKVGLHYGNGIAMADDVEGQAAMVAQGIVKMAKADQTLTSAYTIDALPPGLRMGVRFFDSARVEGAQGEIDVYELVWDVDGATMQTDTRPREPQAVHVRLVLEYQGTRYELTEDRPSISLGRVEGNDIVVPTDLTSRSHAQIEYRRGRFFLTDNSANGTQVVFDEGNTTTLRREHLALQGRGSICLGGRADANPDGVVEFTCE